MENQRRVYNPVQKDYATFLKTSAETNGEITLLEVELAPHGGNGLHIHSDYTERFEVLEGELNVQVGDEYKVLKAGDQAAVPPNTKHRFFSTSDQPARFLVDIRPGHTGFENSLRIAYGMATDGEMTADGTPKNILKLAYLLDIGGMKLTGVLSLLQPLFSVLAAIARSRGVEKQLTERYLQPF